MVKVDVISGFLGAGKTTLIKKLFSARKGQDKIALIENEFGEIGIDSSFLKESGVNIKEINSGCICCSLVGNFEKSLKELIDNYKPDRIIIEPSGVGKLSDIVKAITNTGLELKINILCTVVDGGKCKMYLKNFGEFYIDQISEANVIVVSKTDVLKEEKVALAVDTLKKYNDKATFITTPIQELQGETLLKNLEGDENMLSDLIEELKNKRSHHHEHHHDEECECHGHEHHHDEECGCHEHEHHHDEECGCHEHGHHHDEECECHEQHEHHHGEECGCHEHGHHHDEECECHEQHEHHHGEECECHEHHGHHHADEVFNSWGIETPISYTETELNGILTALCGSAYGMVLRAKGIVKAQDKDAWYHFDLVAGEYEIRTGSAETIGKICVIGSGICTDCMEKLFLKR